MKTILAISTLMLGSVAAFAQPQSRYDNRGYNNGYNTNGYNTNGYNTNGYNNSYNNGYNNGYNSGYGSNYYDGRNYDRGRYADTWRDHERREHEWREHERWEHRGRRVGDFHFGYYDRFGRWCWY